jgi:tRNA A37 threonylcarbamoyladenosine modification protein TsaB
LLVKDKDSLNKDIENKKMNKNFLIIDCTGKNDSIALKTNNKFFIKKLQTNLAKNEILALEIVNFIKKCHIELDSNFEIYINSGPGSFSGIRISLAVAKGIQLAKNTKTFSYNNFLLNAAPYLATKQEIFSIQKTNKFYYCSKGTYEKGYHFTFPEKIDLNQPQEARSLFVIPDEIKDDKIFKKLDFKKIRIAEFNLKNIDLLIDYKLIENKLIKPLYLS